MSKLTIHTVRTPQDRVDLISTQVVRSITGDDVMAFRQLVIRSVLGEVPDRDDMAAVQAVFSWAKANIRYIPDPLHFDLYPTAMEVILAGGGDCDCHVVVVASILSLIGFQTGAKVICTRGGLWHVYPLVFLPRDDPRIPLALDTTWSDGRAPGDEYPATDCKYVKAWIFELRRGALRNADIRNWWSFPFAGRARW